MKKVIIAHCWDGTPEYCWYPYAKRELEARGYQVIVPALPDTEAPELNKWLPSLTEAIGTPNNETFLIGHSAGCITILRYLENLAPDQVIGGVVLVAGFVDDLGMNELKNFFTTEINYSKINQACPKFITIHSDNDPFVPLENVDILKSKLNVIEAIIKPEANHFSGSGDGEAACLELPVVVKSIEKLAA